MSRLTYCCSSRGFPRPRFILGVSQQKLDFCTFNVVLLLQSGKRKKLALFGKINLAEYWRCSCECQKGAWGDWSSSCDRAGGLHAAASGLTQSRGCASVANEE